jgi:oligo-1,6-glucosidase
MAYYRKGDRTLLVVGNYQREPQEIVLETPYQKLLLNNCDELEAQGTTIRMQGYQVLVFEV